MTSGCNHARIRGTARARTASPPGIDPSLIPGLFATYHRLPGQATRAAGGTGLGLLIARAIVEGHGGVITASSTGVAGEGTSFMIEIPLTIPDPVVA